jgi:hypothetical protein
MQLFQYVLKNSSSAQYFEFSINYLQTRLKTSPYFDVIDSINTRSLLWTAECTANRVKLMTNLQNVSEVARRKATVEVIIEYFENGTSLSLPFDQPQQEILRYIIGSNQYKFNVVVRNWWQEGASRTNEYFQAVLDFYSSAQLQNYLPINFSALPLWKIHILLEDPTKTELYLDLLGIASLRDELDGVITKDVLTAGLFASQTDAKWWYNFTSLNRITHYLGFDSFGYELVYDPSFSTLVSDSSATFSTPNSDGEEGNNKDGDGNEADNSQYAHIAWVALAIPAVCCIFCCCALIILLTLCFTGISALVATYKGRRMLSEHRLPMDTMDL